MKVLHIISTYYPATRYGGPVRSVHGLCKALAAAGHDVHVFTTNVDGDLDCDVPVNSPVEMDGVKIWYFPTRWLRRLFVAPEMLRCLKRDLPTFDLVHLHSVFLWPTAAAAWVARSIGTPYIVCPRGMLDRNLIARRSRWVKSLWIKLVERKNLAAAACIHLTSEWERRAYEDLGLPANSIRIVPNGIEPVDANNLPSAGYPLPSSKPYALYLGRINWKKGLDLLVRSWRNVAEWDLVIAGNDEDRYRSRLEQLVVDMGLSDRVHFVGTVRDEDKWGLYRNARVFVLSSLSENFANTVLEAMSMACPVLVSPNVGLSDAVVKYNCGLVAERDEKAISDGIARLQRDEEMRRAMGERGREAARASFSWDAIAAEVESIYREIAGSGAH